MSDSATPRTVAHQAPSSVGFSRQDYWSGLPFSAPGDLPHPGIDPGSPSLQADSLPSEPQGRLGSTGPWCQFLEVSFCGGGGGMRKCSKLGVVL